MISLKELNEKRNILLKETQHILSQNLKNIDRLFSPTLGIVNRIYSFLNAGIAKIFELLSFCIRLTSQVILFLADKSITCSQYINRKIYVWKILSIRKQWYENKKGELYNPKLKATISPSWKVTWNMARLNTQFSGMNSKEEAQNLAFKLWMKKRRLKTRLEVHEMEMTIPLTMSHKIFHNKIRLRKATPQDASVLLTFMEERGHPQGDERMKARIDAYAYGSYHHMVIAERGKRIVGFVAFVIYDLFLSEGKRCHIEELLVEGNPVDLCIKRKLIQAVEDFARDNNSKIIDMTTGLTQPQDHTQDFYKFLGYGNDNSTGKIYFQKEL
jgi:hypothetical protein